MSENRYIKIESLCDKCNRLHKAEGKAGMFSILEEPLPGGRGYGINVGTFAVHNDEELANLLHKLLLTMADQFPAATAKAIAAFFEKVGGAKVIVAHVKVKKRPPVKKEDLN